MVDFLVVPTEDFVLVPDEVDELLVVGVEVPDPDFEFPQLLGLYLEHLVSREDLQGVIQEEVLDHFVGHLRNVLPLDFLVVALLVEGVVLGLHGLFAFLLDLVPQIFPVGAEHYVLDDLFLVQQGVYDVRLDLALLRLVELQTADRYQLPVELLQAEEQRVLVVAGQQHLVQVLL